MNKPLALAIFTAAILYCATEYHVVGRYPIPGNGGFDYIAIDSESRRIYPSHATQVEVVDADGGKFIGSITDPGSARRRDCA